ncbi:DUF6713 family protein [Acidobacteriota bacterium]
MSDILFWMYMTNSILLIIHEIDSAYWKEWDLFKIPGGKTGFLLVHLPLLFFVLYGLVLVSSHVFSGLIFSLVLCLSGFFACAIHTYFLKKGKEEFNDPLSKSLLVLIGIVSVIQLGVTLAVMIV